VEMWVLTGFPDIKSDGVEHPASSTNATPAIKIRIFSAPCEVGRR